MSNQSPWNKAQQYEEKHWKKIADKISTGAIKQLDWYDWKAMQFEQQLFSCMPNFNKQDCKILEIGSGPIGIISFLKWGERYAIDPLEQFYKKNEVLIVNRDMGVKYIKGQGEDIPFDNDHFSLVIIDNVLDHTQNPEKVLKEIYRVLRRKGLLYLSLNIRTTWGTFLHSILSLLGIDKGHPYSYSYFSIQHLLVTMSFSILNRKIENYSEIKHKNTSSRLLKDKIKGYLGISEILYRCICEKM